MGKEYKHCHPCGQHDSPVGNLVLIAVGTLLLLKLFGICCPSRLIVIGIAVLLILKGLQGLLR